MCKAKLISLNVDESNEREGRYPSKEEPIHAYFGMIKHVFQRNKKIIEELRLSGIKIKTNSKEKRGKNSQKLSESDRTRNRSRSQSRKR